MIVVGLDFETTGLDAKKTHVVEIGAHLYDIKNGKSLAIMNCFPHYDPMVQISPKMTAIHGISQEMYESYGVNHVAVWKQFTAMAKAAEFVMAHNATFEKNFLRASFKRAKLMHPKLKWIDTCVDIPYPSSIKRRKLEILAKEHKVRLVNAHRAMPDVNAMLAIAQKYDVDAIRALAADANVKVRALVNKMDKDKAKSRNFYWDPDRRIWWRNIKTSMLKQVRSDCDFEIKVLTT